MTIKPRHKRDYPLADLTTYKIGGSADTLYIPENFDELLKTIQYLVNSNEHFHIIGGGSNLLISDNGIKNPVVLMTKCCNQIDVMDYVFECGCSVPLQKFVDIAIDHGFVGVDKLAGIPGTLGGALLMNAGAYGQEISDFLTIVTILDEYGKIKELTKSQIRFAYRCAPGLARKVILRGRFEFHKKKPDELKKSAQEIIKLRKSKHPMEYPSAGSVFKKHPLGPAGKLIDQAGLKGLRIGDAQVSEKHANFIVNLGKARAIEVLALIRKIQKITFELYGAELELEQRLIGFNKKELNDPQSFL